MTNPFVPRVGGVLSADIAVADHANVVRFYRAVLGTGAEPFWQNDLMNNRGVPIIGLGERTADHEALPLQWMPHFQVADVGESVERTLEAGGRKLLHGDDDTGAMQWAVLEDPDGAAFGVIPVVPASLVPEAVLADGRDAADRVGRIRWLDLTVPDASRSRTFYERVIGWSSEGHAMRDDDGAYEDYAMTGEDGAALAGVCHARGGNTGLPAVWLMYLPVGDFEESLRRVVKGGGAVVARVDGAHTYAVVRDPVGAHVALTPA